MKIIDIILVIYVKFVYIILTSMVYWIYIVIINSIVFKNGKKSNVIIIYTWKVHTLRVIFGDWRHSAYMNNNIKSYGHNLYYYVTLSCAEITTIM